MDRTNPATWAKVIDLTRRSRNTALKMAVRQPRLARERLRIALTFHRSLRAAKKRHEEAYEAETVRVRDDLMDKFIPARRASPIGLRDPREQEWPEYPGHDLLPADAPMHWDNLDRYVDSQGNHVELDYAELEGRLGAWPKGTIPSDRFLSELGKAEWPEETPDAS